MMSLSIPQLCANAIVPAVLLLFAARVDAASFYKVVPLSPPEEAVGLYVSDISNAGQIVGTVSYANENVGFSYRDGVWSFLTAPADHTSSSATVVNDLGQIAGWTTEVGIPKSAMWLSADDGSPEVLESSGGSDANVYAMAINNNGVIAGFYTGSGSGNTSSWRAVKWQADAQGRLRQEVLTTGVSPLPDGVFHAAYGLNNLNQVVGTGAWNDAQLLTSQAAIQWESDGQPGELTPFMDFGFAPRFEARAINDQGVSVGSLVTNTGVSRALLWQADGTVSDLGVLEGFNGSEAVGINVGNSIVGTHFAANLTTAALYEDGRWIDLNTRLLSRTGRWLRHGIGINDLGWIIAQGIFNGVTAGFVLVPIGDAGGFPECLSGPDAEPLPELPHTTRSCLLAYDINEDGAVDLADFATLQNVFGVP